MGEKLICQNRQARRNYIVLDSLEAGIALKGSEIKSIRAGRVHLKDSYARVENGEVLLYETHIGTYDPASRENHDPTRPRKLLLHKREIRRLYGKTREKGLSLIPMKLYLKEGRVKVELAVAKGKRTYEKREDLRKRESTREIEKAMSRRREGG